MATATESARRSATRNGTKDPGEQSRALAREAGQDAQEAVSRSIQITVDTLSNLSEISQQLSRQIFDMTLATSQEAFRVWPELSSSVLDGMRGTLDRWPVNAEAVNVWQGVLDASTDAFSRYTKSVQQTAEEGTERINQAVSSLAERMQDTNKEVGELSDRFAKNRAGRAGSSPSGASGNSSN